MENGLRNAKEAKVRGEFSLQGQENEGGQLLESQKEAKVREIEPSVREASNKQVLREIKWKVVEQMREEPKFMELGFNFTNYEAFVKQALEMKEQLREEGVIPVSEECSVVIKQEIMVLKKLKDPGSCTFPCNVGNEYFDKAMCDIE